MFAIRLLQKLFSPVWFLLRAVYYPIRARSRKKVLEKHGWLELHLEGNVVEVRHPPRFPPIVQKILRREEPIKVVLSRLRRFVDEAIEDPYAKGVLVRLGSLGGGWASAHEIKTLLGRLKEAKKEVVIHAITHLSNKELLVASAGTKVLMPPTGMLAAVGVAAPGLFLKEPLEKIGVTVEVAGEGRFKSAPDRFTRTDRSEYDREQVQALIDEFDDTLIKSVMDSRVLDRESAQAMLDDAPLVATSAKEKGYVDDAIRDEALGGFIQDLGESEEVPAFVGAGTYLHMRNLPNIVPTKKKYVGIVEVHGAIVDHAPGRSPLAEGFAVDRPIVDDLRAALEDKSIHSVVLHVNSRGGSVTASDAIYAAVKRLDESKPVIACFGDVSASGGYYIGCGARNIVCSPLTVTGSIGVFSMMPTWPKLVKMLDIGHDVLKNRRHADLYDPWSGISAEDLAHAQKGVAEMYDAFISLVAESRGMTKEEAHEVAEGRVWTGRAAREKRLVDGLGGMEEAVERAKDAAGGRFHRDPVLVKARGRRLRPKPFVEEKEAARALLGPFGLVADDRTLTLLTELRVMMSAPKPTLWSWTPLIVPE